METEDTSSKDEHAATSASDSSGQSHDQGKGGTGLADVNADGAAFGVVAEHSLSPFHMKEDVNAIYRKYLSTNFDASSNWDVLSEKATNELSMLLTDPQMVAECIEDMFVLFMSRQKRYRGVCKAKLNTHYFTRLTGFVVRTLGNGRKVKYNTFIDLIQTYPEFEDRPDDEQQLLLRFANEMVNCFRYIRPNRNKGRLLRFAIRLSEGFHHRNYTTGGGMTQPTKDRLLVFERESDIPKARRAGGRRSSPRPAANFTPIARAPGPDSCKDTAVHLELEEVKHKERLAQSFPRSPDLVMGKQLVPLQLLTTPIGCLGDGFTAVYEWPELQGGKFDAFFDHNWDVVQSRLLDHGWTLVADGNSLCLVKPNFDASVSKVPSLHGILFFANQQEVKDYLKCKLQTPIARRFQSPMVFIEDGYVAIYGWDLQLQQRLRTNTLQESQGDFIDTLAQGLQQDGWVISTDVAGLRLFIKPGYPQVLHPILENKTFFKSEQCLLLYLKEKLRCPPHGRLQRPCLHISDGYHALYSWLRDMDNEFGQLTNRMLAHMMEDGWKLKDESGTELFFKPRGYIAHDCVGKPPTWSLAMCDYFDDRAVLLLYFHEKAAFPEIGKSRSPDMFLSDGYSGIYRWPNCQHLKHEALWRPQPGVIQSQDLYVSLINDGWTVNKSTFIKPGYDLSVIADPAMELIAFFTSSKQMLHYVHQKVLFPSVGQLSIACRLALVSMETLRASSAETGMPTNANKVVQLTTAMGLQKYIGGIAPTMRQNVAHPTLATNSNYSVDAAISANALPPTRLIHSAQFQQSLSQPRLPYPPLVGFVPQPVPMKPIGNVGSTASRWYPPGLMLWPQQFRPTQPPPQKLQDHSQHSPSPKRKRQAAEEASLQVDADDSSSEPPPPYFDEHATQRCHFSSTAAEDNTQSDTSIHSFSDSDPNGVPQTSVPTGHVRRKRFVPS